MLLYVKQKSCCLFLVYREVQCVSCFCTVMRQPVCAAVMFSKLICNAQENLSAALLNISYPKATTAAIQPFSLQIVLTLAQTPFSELIKASRLSVRIRHPASSCSSIVILCAL